MEIVGIIPARFGSSRFPGKPLVSVLGKSMIQRVWERATSCTDLDDLVVATDDVRIWEAVREFGGKALMTNPAHPTGTDRILETIAHFPGAGGFVNIQGDEPFISPTQISQICTLLRKYQGNALATLVARLGDMSDLSNPNVVKVVLQNQGKALYFSRAPIPFMRNPDDLNRWNSLHGFWRHIGIYGYTRSALDLIQTLPVGILEQAESLEQLRWLEGGLPIWTQETQEESHAIDTPEDLARIETLFGEKQ